MSQLREHHSPPPKLLVIDDDAGLLRLMSKALQREGFAVVTADSEPAVEARLPDGPFTLMLIDLRLEKITGLALLEKLWKRNIAIPFLVITGQGDERVAVEMMRNGALDYLLKDADFLEIMPTRVRRAVEHIQQKERLIAAEEALKREHAFLSAILGTAGALVIVLDGEGQIVRFNPAAEQVTGFAAAELLGENFVRKLVPEDDRAAALAALERMQSGEQQVQREGKLKAKNGQIRVIAWSNTQIHGAGGQRFVIETGIDITARRRLEEQIVEISAREQRRIGQDLHDGLGQHLTGIELMTHTLEQTLAAGKRAEAEQAAKISKYVREAIRQSKTLARGLSPVELDRNGLMSALQELAGSTSDLCRIQCVFECPVPIQIDDNKVATQLYRIAQEAVNNAVKHGRARKISIRLAKDSEVRAKLAIRDDGAGFARDSSTAGMGLGIMQYRASVIGGVLDIQSELRKGTEVRCAFSYAK